VKEAKMEPFFWWGDAQKEFCARINAFVDEHMGMAEEAWWRRQYPWELHERVAERGYYGAGVPKEYGGLGLGVTGACIGSEALSRMPGVGRQYTGSMLAGLHQISQFGTEGQKEKFLRRIAGGEMGAIAITEPFVGTDVAATETHARRDGNRYIISGKKRFVVGAGVAGRYMLYARTSFEPEDRRRYRHLTAFIVEKGMPGFTTEKVNELIGFENTLNGHLDLQEVPVPVDNRIGEEGEGWNVMMSGLNFERTASASQAGGWIHELIRYAVSYGQRRVQFGRRTIDMPNNQFKIADLIAKLHRARLSTFYAAHCLDSGEGAAVEASVAKVSNMVDATEAAMDAIQVMGGDGTTKFYPLEEKLHQARVEQIAGGTNEAVKLIIFRQGLRAMAEALKMPHRVRHKELGVPITAVRGERRSQIDEEGVLRVLADDYTVNPGLHMSLEDLKEVFDATDEELKGTLQSMEEKGLVSTYRSRQGEIELVKATYPGLNKANPPEFYRWFPSWVRERDIF